LPGAPQQDLPLTSLGSLGVLGFDRRDIHDGFSLSRGTTEYPAIWGQQSRRNRTLLQRPNRWLHPLSRARQGRNLRHADVLWARAGRVLLAERMRLNTSRLAAAWSDEPVLANVWWTFVLEGEGDTREAEKALVLWLNSSLGLTMLMGYRSETEGAFVDFKKPALSSMPVLDVLGLPLSVIHDLAAGFDHLCTRELQAPPRLCEDQVRCDLDYVLCECLQLSDLSRLREALAREPILAQSMIALLPGPAH